MLILFKMVIFIIIFLYLLIAIILAVNPYYVWKINESWKAVKEPSKEYFIFYRIGGIIAAVLGIVFLIIIFKAFKG